MGVELTMPRISEETEEGIVVTWFVPPGARVEEGDLVAEVQVEKVSTDVTAPATGWLASVLVEAGGTARQGQVIAVLEDAPPAAAQPPGSRAEPTSGQQEERPEAEERRVVASPSARRIARELGVDLAGIPGSGPGGRIVEADVRAAAGQPGAQAAPAPARSTSAVPLSPERRTIAERLGRWLRETAQLTLTAEADVTELAARLPGWGERWGERATYTAAVVAASSRALRDHPHLAARLTDDGLVPAADLDVGVAVELEGSLIVPVVRRADTLALGDLNAAIARLAARARAAELAAEEATGGVFSVTNLGGYGIDAFTPLLNPPQTAILGIGQARPRPAVAGGEVVVRTLMVLSLTFDHRVVDGAPAAAFLGDVVALLEDPDRLEGPAAPP